MHQLYIEKTSPRGRQICAALTLAHLLEIGLPAAKWEITDTGEMFGVVRASGNDALTAICDYAEFLHRAVVRVDADDGVTAWTNCYVLASYRGTALGVWAQVRRRPLDRTEAA
ncbi:hypothetical protein [Actinomadura rupiterrae]|uniref:hypothetical protein n=1 Tax=Actinomadura rupiterrae TaxID=559627 RepID=UPI0020A2C2F5|nr:hypothetical protein [Actinomadura rupiterrae]MCP2339219.1 hypothetical protein [Actinomadura rupiterrae]